MTVGRISQQQRCPAMSESEHLSHGKVAAGLAPRFRRAGSD